MCGCSCSTYVFNCSTLFDKQKSIFAFNLESETMSIELYICPDCALPNCNGKSHDMNSKYIYPTCDTCGIELLDLLELIQYPELRNQNECEVCEEQFTQQNHTNLLEHFQNASNVLNKFHCLDCYANSTENEPTVYSSKAAHVSQTAKQQNVKRRFYAKSTCWKVFDCRICNSFKSSDRSVRNSHEIAEHQDSATKTYGCPDCGKRQTTVYKLQSHMMQHRPQRKPFVCNVCDKDFAERAQLKSHSFTHTTERPYKCNQCAKAYKQSTKLKLHQRSVHEGLRPYKCDRCISTFKECSDLRRHRRVHGGVEKPHQCDICSKRFYELKLLRVHMQSHLSSLS